MNSIDIRHKLSLYPYSLKLLTLRKVYALSTTRLWTTKKTLLELFPTAHLSFILDREDLGGADFVVVISNYIHVLECS